MKRILMILGTAALLAMGAVTAWAQAPTEQSPEAYRTTQGEYTLVIADSQQASGVYKAGELLYPMADTNNISEAYLSADGQQVAVVYGETIGKSKESLAVAFYNQGRLTQSYTVHELALGFMTDKGEQGIVWEEAEQRSYDAQAEQLTLVSKDNSKRIFSLLDGSILYEENPVKIGLYAGIFLFFLIVFGVFWFSKYNSLRNASLELQRQDKQKECMRSKGFEASDDNQE